MNREPLQILLCQGLFAEARAAMALKPLPGVEVACLPHSCAPRKRELESLLEAAERQGAKNKGALLVGGGCLSACRKEKKGTRLRLAMPSTCFHFFAPAEQIEVLLGRGGYLVTAGWLAGWRKHMAEWALEPPEARDLFGESCRAVILLDTGLDPGAGELLAEFSEYVGLPAERIPVGLAHLRAALLEEAWTVREEQTAREAKARAEDLKQARRRIAEEAALVDLVHRLSARTDEKSILEELLLTVQSLFAPAQVLWIPHWKGLWGEAVAYPPGPVPASLEAELRGCRPGVHATSTGDGILLHLVGLDESIGLLGLGGLPFSEQLPSYLEIARTFAQAAQLALGNARNLHGMFRMCAWCRRTWDPLNGWVSFEQYVHDHSPASVTHGMCTDCAVKLGLPT